MSAFGIFHLSQRVPMSIWLLVNDHRLFLALIFVLVNSVSVLEVGGLVLVINVEVVIRGRRDEQVAILPSALFIIR